MRRYKTNLKTKMHSQALFIKIRGFLQYSILSTQHLPSEAVKSLVVRMGDDSKK